MIPKSNTGLVSVVIPAKDEEGSVEKLYNELRQQFKKIKRNYEIIFVDDGSTDDTFIMLKKLRRNDRKVKIIKHRGNWGKSMALMSGFSMAKGRTVLTMDADLQDNPADIPQFLKLLDGGNDLVSGWKKKRKDPWHKVLPSRVLNYMISNFIGIKIHDTNCGYKAYDKTVVDSLNLYGELYRFIPVIAAKQNFKVTEVAVHHRARKHGKSKYNWTKNIRGFLDLLTIIFLTSYLSRPGHFFGSLGLISFSVGTSIGAYITFLRVTTGSIQFRTPLLMLGILLIIIGIQLITTGLIAEMIVSISGKSNSESAIEKKYT